MKNMSTYIKRCREEAGLTQAQLAEKMDVSVVSVQNWENGRTKINIERYYDLAEILSVPIDDLIKEMIIEADKSRQDEWPYFLFDKNTNEIIDTLHLNLAQQDLFGLMYIYGSECFDETLIEKHKFEENLKRIPYGFIDRVGSIRFMNQAEGLYKVIRYVKTDFLMKVLKQNPEFEFNIKKLSRNQICEFIDEGCRSLSDFEEDIETSDVLNFEINMRKSRIILPILEKVGKVHITDGNWSNPIRSDLSDRFLDGVLKMCNFKQDLWEEGYFKREYNISYIRNGLESVTDYKNTARKGHEERWVLSINEKGRNLLKWIRNQEYQSK